MRRLPSRFANVLAGRQELVSVLANLNWLVGQRVLEAVLGLLIGVVITRYLGPDRYGQYSFVAAIVALFAPLATLGSGSIAMRDLVRRPADAAAIMGSGTVIRIAGGLLMVIAAVVTIHLTRPGDTKFLWMAAMLCLGNVALYSPMVDCWFRARVESRYIVISNSISKVIFALIKLAMVRLGASLLAFVLAVAGEAVAAAGLQQWLYAKTAPFGVTQWTFDRRIARQLFADSWPLLLAGFMGVIYMRSDQVMLGQMRGDHDVGIYSAALSFSAPVHFMAALICDSVFPSLVRVREQDRGQYLARFQLLYDAMVWLTLAGAAFVTLIGHFLVTTLLGKTFGESGTVLTIQIWSSVFVFSGSAGHSYLMAENRGSISLLMTVAGALLNIAANWLLIPHFGVRGSAVATLISFSVSHLLGAALFRDSRILLTFFFSSLQPVGLLSRWRGILSAARKS
jgi:PST family polysaccharide transporter